MCGILGSVNFRENLVSQSSLEHASGYIKQRGPDDVGYWIESECSLAHRRLSIIDLSTTGHQPMLSHNQRYACIFNGEIYNFLSIKSKLKDINWRGYSDTEVLLEAWSVWGVNTLEEIDGMFAFAIWDRLEKKLTIARDRIGEKPLYYYLNESEIVFSSRPTPIFKLKPNITKEYDLQGLRYYLDIGFIPAPHSIHLAIKKLPAGHYLEFSRGQFKVTSYWDLKKINTEASWKNRNENDLVDELEEIFLRNIKLRMISDVPLGAFLSGGVDSSLVVAMMKKLSNQSIKTFTIGFKEKKYDESLDAQKIASHLQTQHTCEFLEVDDLLAHFPNFFLNFDEPFFDSAAFPTMAVSKLARKSVTVALTGDGGDELFGGYHYYKITKYLGPLFLLNSGIRCFLGNCFSMLPKHQAKLLSGAISQDNIGAAFAFSRSIAKDFESVLSEEVANSTQGISQLFLKESDAMNVKISAPDKAMRLDTLFTLNDDYLQKTDVASMAFSLESRAPILSREIVEWALKLPSKWKIKNIQNKYLLRKLAYRYVPQELLDKPKRGFGVPIDQWLRTKLKNWAEDRINNPANFDNLPILQNNVKHLFKLHLEGRRNSHPLLWAVLIMLEFDARQRNLRD